MRALTTTHRGTEALRKFLLILGASVPLCVVISGVIHAQQQTQQPVFRTTTRLIVQTITVKDKDGKVIEGLTAQDFAVTEDGQPQEIAFVEFQRMQGTTAAAPAALANNSNQPTQTPPPAPPPADNNLVERATV